MREERAELERTPGFLRKPSETFYFWAKLPNQSKQPKALSSRGCFCCGDMQISPSKATWRSYRIPASQEPVGFLLRKNLWDSCFARTCGIPALQELFKKGHAPFCRLRDRTSAKIATLFSCVLLRSPAAELPPNDKTKVSSIPNVKVLLLFFLQKVGQRTSAFGAILLISGCSSTKNKRSILSNDTLIFI